MKPLITTIIPTYRRPNLLRRAILSVLKQTYPHFQVRVYDNASRDETAEVVAELARQDSRVTYHAHDRNIGAMANFQYGYDRVDTPYFSFLSDDNFLFPGFYLQAVQHLEENGQDIFYCAPMLYGNEEGQVETLTAWPEGRYRPPDAFLRLWENVIVWDAVLFRSEVKNIVRSLSGYYADLSLLMRGALTHPFYFSKDPGACEIRTRKNLSLTMKMQDIRESLSHLRRDIIENGDLPEDLRELSKQAWRKMAIGRYFSMCAKKYMEGESDQVRQAADCLRELGDGQRTSIVRLLCRLEESGTLFRWIATRAILARQYYVSRRLPKLTPEETRCYQRLLDDAEPLHTAVQVKRDC